MKYHFFALISALIFFSTAQVNAQESNSTYIINNKSNAENIDLYTQALSKANLDKYRLENAIRILKFDSGVEVELLSIRETEKITGKSINKAYVNQNQSIIYPWPFSLSPEGIIIEKLSVIHKNK